MTDIRTLIDLVEMFDHDPYILVNPNRSAVFRRLRGSHGICRMSVDDEGNVFIWNARMRTHDDVYKKHKLVKTGELNRLSGLSLYAMRDGIAARVYEVGDEEVHPELTELARQLPNIVRIWGSNVTCIDMHGEP